MPKSRATQYLQNQLGLFGAGVPAVSRGFFARLSRGGGVSRTLRSRVAQHLGRRIRLPVGGDVPDELVDHFEANLLVA
jgi:hypothetical protein